jgi:hypothetical protein
MDDRDKVQPQKDHGKEAQTGEKPKTEQASHQGGGGVRSDGKPQGPGTEK